MGKAKTKKFNNNNFSVQENSQHNVKREGVRSSTQK